MRLKWLAINAPASIKNVDTFLFPVTVHSFMPADRVLSLLEMEIKNKYTIVCKEEYHEIFKQYGTFKLIERTGMSLSTI